VDDAALRIRYAIFQWAGLTAVWADGERYGMWLAWHDAQRIYRAEFGREGGIVSAFLRTAHAQSGLKEGHHANAMRSISRKLGRSELTFDSRLETRSGPLPIHPFSMSPKAWLRKPSGATKRRGRTTAIATSRTRPWLVSGWGCRSASFQRVKKSSNETRQPLQ